MKNKLAFNVSWICVLVFGLNMATLVHGISRLDVFNSVMALAASTGAICVLLLANRSNVDYNSRINSNLQYFKYRASIFAKPGFEKLSIRNCQNAYKLGGGE